MDSLPELPLQDIRDTIEEQLKGLPDEFEKKEKELRSEWELHKRRDADYPIKNTKGDGLIATLKKNDQESRLHEVAGMLILEGDFADKVAEKVVEKMQPKITELKPAMMPGFIWGKIEEKLKAKIEDMVSDSVKVSIESFLRSKGCTDVQLQAPKVKAKKGSVSSEKIGDHDPPKAGCFSFFKSALSHKI